MATPPIPRFDKGAFPDAPELAKYHGLLSPFLEGVGQQLGTQRRVHVSESALFSPPDDWVPITFAVGSPWAASGGGRQKPRWRYVDDGNVEVQGAFTRTGSAGGVEVIASGLPKADGLYTYPVGTSSGFGSVDINGSGQLVYVSGGAALTIVNAVYTAATRTHPTWTTPLEVGCPFLPVLVLVVAQEVDARKRPTGAATTYTASWQASPKGYSIVRCPGLLPLRTYTLTSWAVAG